MASAGSAHRQIFFEDDPCCFWWRGRTAQIRAYEAEVNAQLKARGEDGAFLVHLIENQQAHRISKAAVDFIDRDAQALSGGAP